MDYSYVIDELIAKYDLGTEEGRSAAHAACIRHANENLRDRRSFNAFMQAVAERLGTVPVRLNDFSDAVSEPPANARIHVKVIKENLVNVTGNADGLRYLASIILELARDAVEHDHAHLYADEPPMCGDVCLTVYHEPDPWFEHLREQEGKQEEPPASISAIPIDPSDVAALCVLAEIPETMPLTKCMLYRVVSAEPYRREYLWERRIREGNERFFIFTLRNDEGVEEGFGFDLDDPDVLFVSRQNIAHIRDDG